MSRETSPVSFRLDGDYLTRLKKLGARHNGMSPGEMARKIVMDYLDDSEREQLGEKLMDVQESLEALRVGVADGIEALLIQVGLEGEKAQEFVNETIRAAR